MSSQTVYCLSCGQTYVSSNPDACTLCGARGGVIDPQSPEALRDLMLRRQQDATGWPQTFGDWCWSIFDTFNFFPYTTLGGLIFVVLIVVLNVLLLIQQSSRFDADQPSPAESATARGLIAFSTLFLVRVVIFYFRWKRVLAFRAAEKSRG